MRIQCWLLVLSLLQCQRGWSAIAAEETTSDTGEAYYYEYRYREILDDKSIIAGICPDYTDYARRKHKPLSNGPLELPFQRPNRYCRKFTSPAVEKVLEEVIPKIKDPDIAQIFQNAFPNTLDTTVRWHVDGKKTHAAQSRLVSDREKWQGAQSFIVTGDINAEWLRDSTNQLAQYQLLASSAPDISNLILGAINTQAEYVIQSPYCNAFQPPEPADLDPVHTGSDDWVTPVYEPSFVFECKYELDSLANFLSLTNQYHASTGSFEFLTHRWYKALESLLSVLDAQARPTFDPTTHKFEENDYTFTRNTRLGTETLPLNGVGNPLAGGTGLIRSAFRPSDDATIFGFLIPSNAMMSVELARTAKILSKAAAASTNVKERLYQASHDLELRSQTIRDGIFKHAVIKHVEFGEVFAYEIDGYGSHLLMDDANIPSLLSLPLLGFIESNHEIYKNTRNMILSSQGNPYFLSGKSFSGIGGPHIGLRNAWPMSLLVQAMTTDNDTEILECLNRVKNVSLFGLINESVNVENGPGRFGQGMTRSWFAWANSVFAQTILDLLDRKPDLVLVEGSGRYVLGKGFV